MPESLTVQPIGVARTPFVERADAPRQPRTGGTTEGRIELFAGRGLEDALVDLDSWDHIWVIYWFDRNDGWRPKVQPPRSRVKRGVLATRAPHRPNPIGLSALRLLRVEGLALHVADVNLLDGTPVLDIKPYLAFADALPDANGGWLERERVGDPGPSYDVRLAPLAREQVEFLRGLGVDIETRIRSVLALGPEPHAYRRIRREGGVSTLAVKEWRVCFVVEGARMRVDEVRTGYRPAQLFGSDDPALDVHRAFVERFGMR